MIRVRNIFVMYILYFRFSVSNLFLFLNKFKKKTIISYLLLSSKIFCVIVSPEQGKFPQTLNGTPASSSATGGMDPFHACSILQQLKAMYDEGQLTDIVVEVDHGKTFSCHRNVLAAISPYFRYILFFLFVCVCAC